MRRSKQENTEGRGEITVAEVVYDDTRSPLMAIRRKCLDCCAGSSHLVKLCTANDCPLWSRRFGHQPLWAKRKTSLAI